MTSKRKYFTKSVNIALGLLTFYMSIMVYAFVGYNDTGGDVYCVTSALFLCLCGLQFAHIATGFRRTRDYNKYGLDIWQSKQ